ncbi:MAG: hypothetical protein EXR62_01020 [Chloroflexi bacterium]|nr:hypothetical protein [Chloroflexota bacterium]
MAIVITVFGHPAEEVCLISGCGAKVKSQDTARETATTLQNLFGGRVVVRYIDVTEPALRPTLQYLLDEARQRKLPWPLVAIDSEIVLAGVATPDAILRKLNSHLAETAGATKAGPGD